MRDAAMADERGRKAEEALLLALACGATVDGAAHQAGLSERTAYRRLADKNFQRRLREMRADMVQRAAGALTATSAEAVRALLELLKSSSPAAVRLRAARAVIELGCKLRDHVDVAERVKALEVRLDALLDDSARPGDA
jgi:uroporphyrinogen-III synthase